MRVFRIRTARRIALLAILMAVPGVPGGGVLSITDVFGAATIPVGGTTSLTFTLVNPFNGITATGMTFTDTLPAGLVVATPNGLSGNCGGTVTAVAGSNSIGLTGGTTPQLSQCTFSVNVTATAMGMLSNSTSGVSWDEGPTGSGGTALITATGALNPTPAPASWILLGTGMLAILVWSRRQSRQRTGA
jgi:hypothetical protein